MSLQLDSVCSELDQLKRSLGIQADPKVSLREIHLARKELEDTQIKPPSQKSRIVPQVIKNEFDIEDLKALITKIVREQVQQALLVFEKNRMSNILAQFSLEIEARLEKKFLGLQADTSRSATPTKSNMVRKLTPADKNVDAIFGKLKTKFAQKSKLAHPKAAPKSATAKRAYQSHTQSSVLKKKI